ncbi:pentapeptide repeat-containing protein [Pinisolibacter aquiterrae]|uniref:pentapeptide repeat-containing protein n=1 Tax=Pinisolibacter aquiterrae TaxID=2815579 RepID=UPI001C3E1E60|nr:pentapeptide repeat-containing protein [Pinisolibacter aquiterrae]MBV5265093.1 pentapeptide repeat-containing protein [Pinisolibacter aquiterrae]MCC8235577.1 pentapeptide repeat-containing protein [Pinisolibacter aquiterrae]
MTAEDAAVRARTVYDQAFFLALARPRDNSYAARLEALERWNAWRRDPANAAVSVNFTGVDFRAEENVQIRFEGFEFGDRARFDGATFNNGAKFHSATFGALARFVGARFRAGAVFNNVRIGLGARFDGASFGDGASLHGATFGNLTCFDDATFAHGASFVDAAFGIGTRFVGATFGALAQFRGATFDDRVSFDGACGEGDVKARRWEWETLGEAEGERREKFYRDRRESEGFGPAKFSIVSFTGAHFRGNVSFARRSFEHPADFTGVRFDAPPEFDGATNLQRINFTGARIRFAPADRPWWKPHFTTNSTVAIRLRALRSQIEATKNHDFERDLYIEERKAERGIYFDRYLEERRWAALAGHCLWIGVMAVYWAFSDYGRSWLRPAIWLALSIPAFHLLYAHLLADRREITVVAAREAVTKTGEGKDALVVVKGWQVAEARVLADYDATVGQLAVSNAVPFVGPLTIDGDAKKFLYCGVWPTGKGETIAGSVVEPCRPIPPPGFQAAMISQNLLSILLVFFIGLALRNYFRVK